MISVANKEVAKDIVSYNEIFKLDDKVIRSAIDNFNKHVNAGFVINSSFESDIWLLDSEIKKAKISFIANDLIVKQSATKVGLTSLDYVVAVKVYIALHFGAANLEFLKTLPQELLDIGSISVKSVWRKKYKHLREVIEFLGLLNAHSEEIKEIIREIEKVLSATRNKSNARELPLIESVGIFDEIIVDYWENADSEKLYYYPVYLWWILTTVLPLRVTEFILIPYNCIKNEEGKYWITVRRSKLKGRDVGHKYTLNEDYELCTYRIPEKIAKEFIRYKKITKDYKVSPIDTLFKLGPYLELIAKKDTTNRLYDYYTASDFSKTLNKFYKNIVEGKYRYHVVKEASSELFDGEIEAINPGDSRHFALINIVLSTNSVMLAKELARHSNVDTTVHYISNLPSVVKSQTYRLAKMLKSKNGKSSNINGKSSNMNGNVYELYEYQNNNYSSENLIKVEWGWCTSPKLKQGIVEDCMHLSNEGKVGDCKDCQFLVDEHGIRQEKPFTLEDCSRDVELQVAACLWVLDQLRNNMGSEEKFIREWNKLKIAVEKYKNELFRKYMGGLDHE